MLNKQEQKLHQFLTPFKTLETFGVIVLLFLAAFLRLYRIGDYLTFLGDEGRDVLIVKHILDGHLVGIGPTASVGGFFTGPAYYYMMAPFLWLWHLDPVGPAVMVGLFGTATVLLVYLLAKKFFDTKTAFFAATLYTISPLVIAYSRSSWNPNPMPFFTLATIFSLYYAYTAQQKFLYFLTGLLYGITLQLHYIETFFGVAIGIFLITQQFRQVKQLLTHLLFIAAGVLITYIPFIGFEMKHGFTNTIGIIRFITGSTGETGLSIGIFLTNMNDVIFRLFGRLLLGFPPPDQVKQLYGNQQLLIFFWLVGVSMLILASLVLFIMRMKKNKHNPKIYPLYFFFCVLSVVSIILFGFYKKPIYDYYLAFLFPLPFLLVGNLLALFWDKKQLRLFCVVIFGLLLAVNLSGIPFRYPANKQLQQVKTISEFVMQKADSNPYNFAIISGGNSDHAYRYFFEVEGKPPVTIENQLVDPQRKTVTNQLFVVCETLPCGPLGYSLFEIAGFGRAEIVQSWDVSVVTVYKLIRYSGNN